MVEVCVCVSGGGVMLIITYLYIENGGVNKSVCNDFGSFPNQIYCKKNIGGGAVLTHYFD